MGKAQVGLVVSAAAVFAAFALAACGGGNSSNHSTDEDQITAAITRDATSGDPAACTQVQTQKFTEQSTPGVTGAAAVKQCEQDAADSAADKVDVTDIEVDGDNATAKVAATGSIVDGQTLDIALVKEGEQWKLDELKGFEDFNREAMIAAFRKQLSSEPGATIQAVTCVIQGLQAASDQEIEGIFTGSNAQALLQLFGRCAPTSPVE